MKNILFCGVLLMLFHGCIEPYEFVVQNETPGIVIDGYITNTSYSESLVYPSDGHFMQIKLSYTSDVDNVENSGVGGAKVMLQDDQGSRWEFNEANTGIYILYNYDFKAQRGVAYQLVVTLPEGDTITSSWEKLPANVGASMGDIRFEEVTKNVYDFTQGQKSIIEQKGIDVILNLPENDADDAVYYQWNFFPTWIYEAPMARVNDPYKKCWATNNVFLSNYQLHKDNSGGYGKSLFYIPTEFNERIFNKLSVLIVQKSVSDDYFNYWQEIKAQAERGGLFAEPPYNLKTNLESSNPDLQVSGYFGVVAEQAERWYFDASNLSYEVPNTQLESCQMMPWPAPKCVNCENYQGGEATIQKPSWWSEDE